MSAPTVPMVYGKKLHPGALEVLREILITAGVERCHVSSVERTVYDQARIMYDNCVTHGVAHQLRLYAAAGDQVIRVFEANQDRPRPETIALMAAKIDEIGPSRVSKHLEDPEAWIFDVAPSSFPAGKHGQFLVAAKQHPRVRKVLEPPRDPAFHLEILKPKPEVES